MAEHELLSTGVNFLDDMLDGGLIPGTLTLVYGATGVGKTQLGIGFLNRGQAEEGRRGVIVDLTTRGDSQQHAEYARRLFGWEVAEGAVDREAVWQSKNHLPQRYTGLGYSGKRVTREDMTREAWGQWQAELNLGLQGVTAFLYAHLIRGVKRVLIDSVEPCTRIADSIQLELIEYIYQEILRTEYDWVARTLFQGRWLAVADRVSNHSYNHNAVATMILQTSNEVLLEDLIARPLPPGDLAANANTIILLGRLSGDGRTGRGAFVLKHRGRKCSEAIVPFEITEEGLKAI